MPASSSSSETGWPCARACCASWTCSLIAASGVLSSCATSARKAPLGRQQPVDLGQQLVQRVDQGQDLVWHLVGLQRAQQRDIARADLLAQPAQRLQRTADGRADQEAQQHQQQHQRGQQGWHIFEEGAPAALGRSRHLDHALAVAQRVDAPARAVPFDLVQAGFLQRRAGVGQRGVDQPAIAGPDLAHELAIVLDRVRRRLGRLGRVGRRAGSGSGWSVSQSWVSWRTIE